MSGGITFKDNEYWCVAGWCFRAVIRSVVDYLSRNDKYDLHAFLTDEDNNIELIIEEIDTINWPKDKAIYFYGAICKGYEQSVELGRSDWKDPSYFDRFIEHYEKLSNIAKINIQSIDEHT